MELNVIGVGMGNHRLLTQQAWDRIGESECLIGAPRLLDAFQGLKKTFIPAVRANEIVQIIRSQPAYTEISVLVSGDVGFYSLGNNLREAFPDRQVRFICGISSLQYFCAQIGMGWDDVNVISLHGRNQNLVGAVETNTKVFVLTGGADGVRHIGAQLSSAGFGELNVWVGERLSYEDEKITYCTVSDLATGNYDSLSVLMVLNHDARPGPVTHGIPDHAFLRGDVPMTKYEVRSVILSKMQLQHGQVIWDVGAGTGSVSIEVARLLPGSQVFAVDKNPEAVNLIKKNIDHFGLHNVIPVGGLAPEVLKDLPTPDVVFVGGSTGLIDLIFKAAQRKNYNARFVVSAITIETVSAALAAFNELGMKKPDIVQVTVAKAKAVGDNHMMKGQNPIYILSAGGKPYAGR